MAVVALYSRSVLSRHGIRQFAAEVYETSPQNRILPEDFYKAGLLGQVPEGKDHIFRLTYVGAAAMRFTYARPDTTERYVPRMMPVPKLEEAQVVFDTWCLRTVFAIHHERVFGDREEDKTDDVPAFLKDQYGIELIECEFFGE